MRRDLEARTPRHYLCRANREWDGRWHVMLVSIPESQRVLRHRVRTQLTWAGFGKPAPGLWINPDLAPHAEAANAVAELHDSAQAISFVATHVDIGDQHETVSRAWDLSELDQAYEGFIDEFTGLKPAAGEAVLHTRTRLVHEWAPVPVSRPGAAA
jgi:phenylacetic acid degradation operon negative regulatory protein